MWLLHGGKMANTNCKMPDRIMVNNFFTEEEWECVRVCVANAPIPYDITKKKIPVAILDKIGQPKREEHEGETRIKMDLSQYE